MRLSFNIEKAETIKEKVLDKLDEDDVKAADLIQRAFAKALRERFFSARAVSPKFKLPPLTSQTIQY